MRARAALALCLMSLWSCGSHNDKPGVAAVNRYGCGSCHLIPGIAGANGRVGPPLGGIGGRRYIAGELLNNPTNMAYWIQHPQSVNPKTVMPELGVTAQDAKDISALLYTLK